MRACVCVLYARNNFLLLTQVGLHVYYNSPEPCAGPSLGAHVVWLWVGVGRDTDLCFGPTSFLFFCLTTFYLTVFYSGRCNMGGGGFFSLISHNVHIPELCDCDGMPLY